MKITSDPIIQCGEHTAVFAQLTPENNCLVLDTKKEMNSISRQLDQWAKRNRPGCKVKTTGHYPADGKPRAWLVFPEPVPEPKTKIRGNFTT